ncbi:amino acid ABC transporter permease [Cryptosporangium minutisporangium]|uniref:amino acid ABC transporter permease n=1 Tax=Cryptosporangium minutisporangium TaxID=113569 RepID=UPI0035E53C0E
MPTLTDNWDLFLEAFVNTILLFVVSGLFALIVGTLLGAFRVAPVPALRWFGAGYVNLLRNTPLTLVFFFVAFGFPYLEINFSFTTFAIIALSSYTAAFVCEAVRSGINTVPAGQAEAARAVGLTFFQTLRFVILPQAFRAVVPPLASILIALLKNTTIAAGFSVAEAGSIRANLSELGYPALAGLIWVVIGFLILVLPLSAAQRNLERRWSVAR